MSDPTHDQLLTLLTRRQVLQRTSTAALGALVASALPLAAPGKAAAKGTSQPDATLQAFYRRVRPHGPGWTPIAEVVGLPAASPSLAKELLKKRELSSQDEDFIGRNLAKAQLALGDVGTLQLLNATATDAQARSRR